MVYRGTWGRDPEKKGEDVFPGRFVGPLIGVTILHGAQPRSRGRGREMTTSVVSGCAALALPTIETSWLSPGSAWAAPGRRKMRSD